MTPSVWLIGDSTVESGHEIHFGWGQALPGFIREDIPVYNYAKGGCSTLSFLREGRFEPVREGMRRGDRLLIQFGHNDEKDDDRHTDPWIGFAENLAFFCGTARERGARPILVTPVSRRYFAGKTSLLYTHGEYAPAVRKTAARLRVPLVDLELSSRKLFLTLGQEKTAELFVNLRPGAHPDYPDGLEDHTHFSREGARVMAALVVLSLKEYPGPSRMLRDRLPETIVPEEILRFCHESGNRACKSLPDRL